MNKKNKSDIIAFCSLIVFVLLAVVILYNEHQKKQSIITQLTEIAEIAGLENVNVIITSKSSEYDWYNVTVDCSNMDTLSHNKMIELDNRMHVSGAFITEYTSNGDSFRIYSSTRSIYKNNQEMYDDYWNSETHRSIAGNGGSSSIGSYTLSVGVNGQYTYRCTKICTDKCGNACETCLMNGESFNHSPECCFSYSASENIGWVGCPNCGDVSSEEWFNWYKSALGLDD